MRRLLAAVVLTSLAATSAPVDAKCARMHQQPKVLTASVELPVDGGGIVVGTQNVPYDLPDQGEALQKSWGFLTGRDLMQPVITVIAPGLVVYGVQPNMRTTGELTTGSKVIAKLTVTKDKVAKLAAPKVKAITHVMARGRFSAATNVALDGSAPADAIAMVLFDGNGAARSWREVPPLATMVEVYGNRRCGVLPNGTIESKAGEKVTVAWLDKYGRLSAQSKLVAIRVAI